MLHQITITCQVKEEKPIPHYGWGMRLHGFLMQHLPPAVAQELHIMQTRPFSQYLQPLPERMLCWHISLWDDGIAAHFAAALLPLQHIMLDLTKYHQVSLTVLQTTHQHTAFDFLQTDSPGPSDCHLEFSTPTAHAGNGQQIIFPSPALIYHSIIHRIAPYIPDDADFQDRSLVAALSQQTTIQQYALHSASFPIKGLHVSGYIGDLVLRFHGSTIRRIQSEKVLRLAAYTGIGIKTAMGMGGCRVTLRVKPSSTE
ncbi:CRISPR system precrRNA processing endoribonuclease RAMP protein Cas6 [Eubacteriales bacterium OttesenSCG-928-A19]|nr:CRISPR system precrRNA processing endoribonuclease RAMP protein Cas6 [Eubacteriales bacterium OttesenSCG-928-A19]